MLLVIYGVCLLVGGVLIVASILLGGHDADLDAHVEMETDFDGDADLDTEIDGDADLDSDADDLETGMAWIPFLSLRFWIFFAAFFGMTGLILSVPRMLENQVIILIIALFMGFMCGFLASYIVHHLKGKTVGSITKSSDFEGVSGKILLPVSKERSGKIRVVVRGETYDLMAITKDDQQISKDQEALIVRFIKDRVEITKLT